MFQPPSGPSNAVILTADADCTAIAPQLAACNAALGGGTSTCVSSGGSGLEIREPNPGQRFLSMRFPATHTACSGGGKDGLRCDPTQPTDCPSGTCLAGGDSAGLVGPAAIGVSAPGDPLPCGLATSSCSSQSGLLACIDGFYANDGACGTGVEARQLPSLHRAAASQ